MKRTLQGCCVGLSRATRCFYLHSREQPEARRRVDVRVTIQHAS